MPKMEELRKERIVGYNINRIMQEKHVTDEELGKMTSTSGVRIKAITTCSVTSSEEELSGIAESLGVDMCDLYAPVADDALREYNVHYMGTPTDTDDMSKIMNKLDIYVRLLNAQYED